MDIFRQIFSPIEVNTYILADKSGECAIIDCGCYNEIEFNRFVGFLETKMLRPVLLLNTHCHLDHVFGNRRMLEKYGLRSSYCELEEPNRINAPDHALFFGLAMEDVPEAASFISHGQEVMFASVKLKALHVPGHTAGSLAFYSEDDSCVFTGDALFAGSIGRSDLPGGDYQTLINSITKNLLTLPGGTVVWSGHGPATTIEEEKRTNPYLT